MSTIKTSSVTSKSTPSKDKSDNPYVFRFAPSPTGDLHIGGLAMCLCNYMLAKSNGGKLLLRIEDTDQVRRVENADTKLIRDLEFFGIKFDNKPIYQSTRGDIYKKYADQLVNDGKAYHDDGAIRLRAPAKTTIQWHDLVKGEMKLPGLERAPVIMKSSQLPPYNLAACVDDHLMGVTHIIRGEEWLSSTAEHIQLHEAIFGLDKTGKRTHPRYAHLPVICITEDGNKRKLSKRKDKEALTRYFIENGYPTQAIIEYLLTIYNTDFELWRIANPATPWQKFPFRFEKIGSNSPLFDWDKLNDISKNIIANMTCKQINAAIKDYFAGEDSLFRQGGGYIPPVVFEKIFTLLAVDRGTDRPRKDIAKYSDILTEFDYIFKPLKMTPLLEKYAEIVRASKDKDTWFTTVKERATEFGFKNVREFTQALRVALTGREKSTDLYTISKVMLG